MSILKYSVYCKTARRCLLPWSIGAINAPYATFRNFLATNIARANCEPNSSFVGANKDKIDSVDYDMCVVDKPTNIS